ncbi:MAG: hypothetical protein FJY86_04490 [Candidatus Diapherotrites archaeon]|uniref:Uncharacterized protein n=1 Tax=Candidatus Iainarchaeum sp. TaxID=3101447 RepID=A0A8T4CBR3_9ARCH|nr:hypothetical protein [Candidatus Diapherotrites archaeon]
MPKRPNPHSSGGKGSALRELHSRYSLAKQIARTHNKSPTRERDTAIKGIIQSTHKFLREINEERAKHYKKPLTMNELIEIIRESE